MGDLRYVRELYYGVSRILVVILIGVQVIINRVLGIVVGIMVISVITLTRLGLVSISPD